MDQCRGSPQLLRLIDALVRARRLAGRGGGKWYLGEFSTDDTLDRQFSGLWRAIAKDLSSSTDQAATSTFRRSDVPRFDVGSGITSLANRCYEELIRSAMDTGIAKRVYQHNLSSVHAPGGDSMAFCTLRVSCRWGHPWGSLLHHVAL